MNKYHYWVEIWSLLVSYFLLISLIVVSEGKINSCYQNSYQWGQASDSSRIFFFEVLVILVEKKVFILEKKLCVYLWIYLKYNKNKIFDDMFWCYCWTWDTNSDQNVEYSFRTVPLEKNKYIL